ncbi:hypothetical protein A9P79_25710 [Cupriavidus taiwanensis]|nr:hypothetical protein A9P79_25710 [Cupriavidus taiwanensis]
MSAVMARTLPSVAAAVPRHLMLSLAGAKAYTEHGLTDLVTNILTALRDAGLSDACPSLAGRVPAQDIERAQANFHRAHDAFSALSDDDSEARVDEVYREAEAASEELERFHGVSEEGIDLALADAMVWVDRLREWTGWRASEAHRPTDGQPWRWGNWSGENVLPGSRASEILRPRRPDFQPTFTLADAADGFRELLLADKMRAVPWLKAKISAPRDFLVRLYCLAALTQLEASLLAAPRNPYRAVAHAVDAAQAYVLAEQLLWSYSPEGQWTGPGDPDRPRMSNADQASRGGKGRSDLYNGDRGAVKRLWEAWRQDPLLHRSDSAFQEAALRECQVYDDTSAIRTLTNKLEADAIQPLWNAWQEAPHLYTEESFLTAALRQCRPIKGRPGFIRKLMAKWAEEG